MADMATVQPSYLEQIRDRQEKYVALMSQGFGKQEAAKLAGYPQRMSERARKLIDTPELRRRVQHGLLRDHGIAEMANVLREGMRATLPQTDRETGAVTLSNAADHRSRTQAVKVAAELMGMTDRAAATSIGQAIIINLPSGALGEAVAARLSHVPTIEGEKP